MADQDYNLKPLVQQIVAGIDESTQDLEPGAGWSDLAGLFPIFHEIRQVKLKSQPLDPQNIEQGALQRLTGKRLIDANPGQKVFAIAQTFNGFGQFGYYVQTDKKLYFHTCESPKDLHINFATLQTLGVDENNLSLNIFGHQPSSNAAVPDPNISCVFEFPTGDKPAPPSAAHPGVDYILITVSPQNPTTDGRLRTRLIAIDTGTAYDNEDIGFYKTQNACRQDSVPLVDGPDGSHDYPPTNSKAAFLGWGGNLFLNTWVSIPGAIPAVWTPVGDAWIQVGAPSFTYYYRGYIQYNLSGGPFYSPRSGYNYAAPGGVNPGSRIYYQSSVDSRGINIGTHYWTVVSTPTGNMLNASSGPTISYLGGFPTATNSGRYGLIGTTIYQDIKYNEDTVASWQEPKSASFGTNWVWANQSARQNDNGTISNSGNVNKYGFQQDTRTYWQLKRFASWIYNDPTTMQNSAHSSGDLGKYTKINNPYSWYLLSQVGVPVTVTWNYNNQNDRENAFGFVSSDIGKNAHQLDNDSYWKLSDYNRHATNTVFSETYFINLNRLFTDHQNLAPPSLSFMLRAFWDKIHNGNGNVDITVRTYRGGLLVRTDSVVWGMDSNATFVQQQTATKVCGLLSVDGDIVGANLAEISIQMIDGTINITTPSVNGDAAVPCSF